MKWLPYAPGVGSLMYAMVVTQLDIARVVGVISKLMHSLSRAYKISLKHIFRYLVGTKDFGIHFKPNESLGLVGYMDFDFASCLDN